MGGLHARKVGSDGKSMLDDWPTLNIMRNSLCTVNMPGILLELLEL